MQVTARSLLADVLRDRVFLGYRKHPQTSLVDYRGDMDDANRAKVDAAWEVVKGEERSKLRHRARWECWIVLIGCFSRAGAVPEGALIALLCCEAGRQNKILYLNPTSRLGTRAKTISQGTQTEFAKALDPAEGVPEGVPCYMGGVLMYRGEGEDWKGFLLDRYFLVKKGSATLAPKTGTLCLAYLLSACQ